MPRRAPRTPVETLCRLLNIRLISSLESGIWAAAAAQFWYLTLPTAPGIAYDGNTMTTRNFPTRRQILTGTAALGLGAGGYAFKRWWHPTHPMVGKRIELPPLAFVANSTNRHLTLPKDGYLALDFFGTGCGLCRRALPEAQYRFEAQDMQFVAVSLDENSRDTLRTVAQWGLTKPVAWDPTWELRNRLQLTTIPSLVVLDAEGVVAGWFGGWAPSLRRVRWALWRGRTT